VKNVVIVMVRASVSGATVKVVGTALMLKVTVSGATGQVLSDEINR